MKIYPASKLAEMYELENQTDEGFYNYIIESFDNGQKKQALKLYKQQEEYNKYAFALYLESLERVDILSYLLRQTN